MLPVEVDVVLAHRETPAVDATDLPAVRADARADLHDVPETRVVFHDRTGLTAAVDHGGESQLAQLVSLERGLRVALGILRGGSRRPEGIPPDGSGVEDLFALEGGDDVRAHRLHKGREDHPQRHREHDARHILSSFAAFFFPPLVFFFSSAIRARSVSSRNRNVVAVHAASSNMRSPSRCGLANWMSWMLTMRSSPFTRSTKLTTSWNVPRISICTGTLA